MNIFVTVGNGKFEELAKLMDRLVKDKKIKDKVTMQIGHGKYIPEHIKWFRFKSPLDEFYAKADLVISHGGPGIVFEVLRRGIKLIAVPNRNRTDPRHQVEYLRAMAKETKGLLYADNVSDIPTLIEKSRKAKFQKYIHPECTMEKAIESFIYASH